MNLSSLQTLHMNNFYRQHIVHYEIHSKLGSFTYRTKKKESEEGRQGPEQHQNQHS